MTDTHLLQSGILNPADELPFITCKDGRLHYWDVRTTDDAHLNRTLGTVYGLYYLDYLKQHRETDLINDIVQAMPSPPGVLESGFFECLVQYIALGTINIGGWGVTEPL